MIIEEVLAELVAFEKQLVEMTLRLRQIRQDLLETLDRHDPDVL